MPRCSVLLLALLLATGCTTTPRVGFLELDDWHEIRAPLFSIVTHAPRAEALHQARQLVAFTEVLREIMRIARLEPGLPMRIYIFRGWAQYGSFAPPNAVGYILPRLEGSALVLSLQQPMLSTEILFHEYSHYLLRNRHGLAYPTWYDEGLAELLGATLIRGDTAWVGLPISRVRQRDVKRTTSMEVLLGSGTRNLDLEGVQHFYADAWMLVHYVHLSRALGGPERLTPTLEYLKRLNRGIAWREAFAGSFGIGLDDLAGELDAHAQRIQESLKGKEGVTTLTLVLDDPETELVTRDLSRAEAASLLGELATWVGNVSLARSLAGEALAAEPEQARVQELAAATDGLNGDFSSALEHAERAVALAPDDARAHESLGSVWAERARREPESAAEYVERARGAYARATELAPGTPSAWAGLGRTYLEERDCAELADGIAALERARAAVPWDAGLNLDLGKLQSAAGQWDAARGHLEFVTTLSHSPDEVQKAATLLNAFGSAPQCVQGPGK